jgi:hypothetical protein
MAAREELEHLHIEGNREEQHECAKNFQWAISYLSEALEAAHSMARKCDK